MVTQLMVKMTLASVTGIASNYFFPFNIFLNNKLTKFNRSHVLPQGTFSLSLPSLLASIARVPQLCPHCKPLRSPKISAASPQRS